jgi:hypothetical protein
MRPGREPQHVQGLRQTALVLEEVRERVERDPHRGRACPVGRAQRLEDTLEMPCLGTAVLQLSHVPACAVELPGEGLPLFLGLRSVQRPFDQPRDQIAGEGAPGCPRITPLAL